MNTDLLYLRDSASHCSARVVEVLEADVPIVRLDRTIFHPMTRSQRSDRGLLGSAHVLAVELNGGTIDHYVDQAVGLQSGVEVDLAIDASWRLLQSAYQSAGHLLAYAAGHQLPRSSLIGGQHWPDYAAIWLRIEDLPNDADIKRIEAEVANYILQNLSVRYELIDGVRYVEFGELGKLRCRGTHISSTGELYSVRIAKYLTQENALEIRYRAAPIM